MGVLGFGVNTERLKKLGITEVPKCWKDLLDPRLKNEFKLAIQKSSGTGLTRQLQHLSNYGEKMRAFNYLKNFTEMYPNILKQVRSSFKKYSKRRNSTGVGLQNYSFEKAMGAPIELVVPCEGTGELGGISINKKCTQFEKCKIIC